MKRTSTGNLKGTNVTHQSFRARGGNQKYNISQLFLTVLLFTRRGGVTLGQRSNDGVSSIQRESRRLNLCLGQNPGITLDPNRLGAAQQDGDSLPRNSCSRSNLSSSGFYQLPPQR